MTGIRVDGLSVSFGGRVVVNDVSFAVEPGRILAVVGESGAGKSLAVRTLLGLAPRGATVTASGLHIAGADVTHADERTWRRMRGARVGLVTQDALGALDPLRTVGAEVAEPLSIHTRLRGADRATRMIAALTDAGIPDAAARATQRPGELSGGLRQRAVIASAVVAGPAVLVADEPTTALDATVQRRVLALLRSLADDGRAVVIVSHDLGAVAAIADDIAVMRAGRIIEVGTAQRVIESPLSDYTRQLWAAGRRHPPRHREAGADSVPLLAAHGVTRRFGARVAVDDVSLVVHAGRTLGIVGESGSGKTTLARLLVGADRPDVGTVRVDAPGRKPRQFVAQNPRAAFNPTWSVGRSLREALRSAGVPRAARAARVEALLREVELDPALAGRRPSTLSGGQLQRAAIARALATDPRILVLDEPLSALDVSVGARILALLARLRTERTLALVMISHDLGVVGEIADDVIVMKDGRIVESGETATVFGDPRHPFTRELLAAAGR